MKARKPARMLGLATAAVMLAGQLTAMPALGAEVSPTAKAADCTYSIVPENKTLTQGDGFEFEVQWGPDPKEAAKAEKAAAAAQKAKDEAERARRAEDEKIRDRLAELFDQIRDGFSDTASAEIGEHFLPDGAPERLKTLVANLVTRGLFDSYADEGQAHEDLEELHELLPGLFATVKMVDAGKEFAERFAQLMD